MKMYLKILVNISFILFMITYFHLPTHAISEFTVDGPSEQEIEGKLVEDTQLPPIPEDATEIVFIGNDSERHTGGTSLGFEHDTFSTGYDDLSSGQINTILGFADSYWFSLTSGAASVLGLLFAMYPVQIRSLSPSLFRSLVWKKTLLTSFGVGIIVFSGIQFYRQNHPPGGLFAILYSILHGSVNFGDVDAHYAKLLPARLKNTTKV